MESVEFICYLFGVNVYDEFFPADELVFPGFWAYNLPYPIPPIAPDAAYKVTIKGHGSGMEVFSIDTCFYFA